MNISDCWYANTCPLFPDGCNSTCVRFAEMLNLVQKSNIPEVRWRPVPLVCKKDMAVFIRLKDIKDDIKSWVQAGNNIYLYSKFFGNGKTSWAIKLMLSYFNAVWAGNGFKTRGVFISVPEFLDRNREVISNRDAAFLEIRNSILTCDLVIWDDMTASKLTDYNYSMLFNYIDARMLANKSNIFTGNVDFEVMKDYLGGRLASRIWNTSEVLEFRDEDKRGVLRV